MSEKNDKTNDTENQNYIGFMFRKPDNTIWADKIIRGATGASFTHVDCVFIPSSTDSSILKELKPLPSYFENSSQDDLTMSREEHHMKLMFSTYVGEEFTYYVPREWIHRSNETHGMLILQVQPEELIHAWKYLMALCDAEIPYNMADLMLCCVPTSMVSTLIKDVDIWKMPSKVFCSQAMVLMLKQSIQTGRVNALLIKELQAMNSRATSPMELFRKLQPHCIQIDVNEYVQHQVLTPFTSN